MATVSGPRGSTQSRAGRPSSRDRVAKASATAADGSVTGSIRAALTHSSARPSECIHTWARPRTRPSTWDCHPSTSPGPPGRASCSTEEAAWRIRAKAPSSGTPSGHAAAITMIPPWATTRSAAASPLTAWYRFRSSGWPPLVVSTTSNRPGTERVTDRDAASTAARWLCGRVPANTPVRRRSSSMVTSTTRSGGQSEVAALTNSWTGFPSVASQVERGSAMRLGLWASMTVDVAARPGQVPFGPPLQPAKKWGSTNPVTIRRSAST